jgi:WD40 repeat protein
LLDIITQLQRHRHTGQPSQPIFLLIDAGDNGTLMLWDYNTGTPFQNMEDVPRPGSLEAEAGVFCSTFDMPGNRLITGGADKTIKVPLFAIMF